MARKLKTMEINGKQFTLIGGHSGYSLAHEEALENAKKLRKEFGVKVRVIRQDFMYKDFPYQVSNIYVDKPNNLNLKRTFEILYGKSGRGAGDLRKKTIEDFKKSLEG